MGAVLNPENFYCVPENHHEKNSRQIKIEKTKYVKNVRKNSMVVDLFSFALQKYRKHNNEKAYVSVFHF